MKRALVIQHLAFEDLGNLEPALRELDFHIEVHAAATTCFAEIDPLEADLWVVLGGPVGVYETEIYPFLSKELALLRKRLAHKKPTIGICLGAQLIAASLGAQVYPGKNGKEIGWSSLVPGPDADSCPAFSALLDPPVAVLHWHGDTFDLPDSARLLASSAQYPHQAFSLGDHVLALQFHPEVTGQGLEHWYVGHASELAQAKIDVRGLRRQSGQYSGPLEMAAKNFWRIWLHQHFQDEAQPDGEIRMAGRFWLEVQGRPLAGRGRIRLLELVRDLGSISAAAKTMKMSYKAAWDAIEAMNSVAPQPVIIKKIGGSSGGRSELTRYGHALIDAYQQLAEAQDREYQAHGKWLARELGDASTKNQ